ncbi:tyrosine recombinase XerC [Xanthobacteraceae bacterium A53D]
MPRANPPRLSRDTDRHGNVRWYVRPLGRPKVRLRQEYGTDAFWQAYRDAMAGKKTRVPVDPAAAPGSFRSLCIKYFSSSEYKALDQSTRSWRRRELEALCPTKGHLPVAKMEPKHVRHLREELSDRPGVANQRLKALRAMFSWAVEAGELAVNPARDIKLIRYKSNGHHSWTIEEVRRFEVRHPLGTKAYLAMALMLYTAGRREDAVRLGPQHIQDGRVRFTQAKNEDRSPVEIDIPLHGDLAAAISATTVGDTAFLVTEYGKPFSASGFGNWFAERCIEAGVPGRAHGLRKAIAARLAESAATPHEMMAVTGHRTLSEVERYTKGARQAQMADAAMTKLKGSIFVPPKIGVGQKSEKDDEIQMRIPRVALPRGLEPLFSP